MKLCFLVAALVFSSCFAKTDIPTEFPTPEPPPSATPLPKLDLKRDAALEKQFDEIAKDAKGKVGVAAIMLETGDAALLNGPQLERNASNQTDIDALFESLG